MTGCKKKQKIYKKIEFLEFLNDENQKKGNKKGVTKKRKLKQKLAFLRVKLKRKIKQLGLELKRNERITFSYF